MKTSTQRLSTKASLIYNKRYAEADRKAREIEGSVANNSHVAEERVVDNLAVDDSGITEEDR